MAKKSVKSNNNQSASMPMIEKDDQLTVCGSCKFAKDIHVVFPGTKYNESDVVEVHHIAKRCTSVDERTVDIIYGVSRCHAYSRKMDSFAYMSCGTCIHMIKPKIITESIIADKGVTNRRKVYQCEFNDAGVLCTARFYCDKYKEAPPKDSDKTYGDRVFGKKVKDYDWKDAPTYY